MTRIFIISNHLMFGRGLESLLRRESKLDVVGCETDEQKAIEQIKGLHPDVVILYGNGPPCDSTPALMRILRENPGIKVIGLNLKNNILYVYQTMQWVVKGLEDLIKAIDLVEA